MILNLSGLSNFNLSQFILLNLNILSKALLIVFIFFSFISNVYAGDLPEIKLTLKDNSISRSKYPLFIVSVNGGVSHLTYDYSNKLALGADVFMARTDKFYLGAGIEYFKDVDRTNITAINLYPVFADDIFNNKMKIYATFALSFYYWTKKFYPAITPFIRLDYKIGKYMGVGIDFKVPLLFSGRVSSSPFLISKLNFVAFIW